MKKNYKEMGKWWNNKNVELVKIDGKIYALHGWNGEEYSNCWEVNKNLIDVVGSKEYTIRPRYKVEDDIFEVINYDVV